MGERAKTIGEKLEEFGTDLYSGFGWTELTKDREIKCRKTSQHNKKTHGVDLLHSCYDPYRGQKLGIITECKNRQWQSINRSSLNEWVKELEYSIDCAQNTSDLMEVNLNECVVNTGILLVHANDGNFDQTAFYEYLSSIETKSRRNPINIFIAGNDKIDRWDALFKKITNAYKDGFKYVFPCIDYSKYVTDNYLTINHLFSNFIFGEREFYEEHNDGITSISSKLAKKQHIIFSFDDFSINAFKYLCSLFKHFQFESAHEYVFCFYPKKPEDIEFTNENFIRAITLENGKSMIDDKKIKIDFIWNRHISPVDYVKGRGLK